MQKLASFYKTFRRKFGTTDTHKNGQRVFHRTYILWVQNQMNYDSVKVQGEEICYGLIHSVPTQNLPKTYQFLPPDTHTYVCV